MEYLGKTQLRLCAKRYPANWAPFTLLIFLSDRSQHCPRCMSLTHANMWLLHGSVKIPHVYLQISFSFSYRMSGYAVASVATSILIAPVSWSRIISASLGSTEFSQVALDPCGKGSGQILAQPFLPLLQSPPNPSPGTSDELVLWFLAAQFPKAYPKGAWSPAHAECCWDLLCLLSNMGGVIEMGLDLYFLFFFLEIWKDGGDLRRQRGKLWPCRNTAVKARASWEKPLAEAPWLPLLAPKAQKQREIRLHASCTATRAMPCLA